MQELLSSNPILSVPTPNFFLAGVYWVYLLYFATFANVAKSQHSVRFCTLLPQEAIGLANLAVLLDRQSAGEQMSPLRDGSRFGAACGAKFLEDDLDVRLDALEADVQL